jgi:hypothetical protein
MLNEIIVFQCFSCRACEMMTVVVLATVGKDTSLRHVGPGRGKDNCVTLTHGHLPHKVFVEVFNLLGLPELRREGVLVSVSDAAATEAVEAPLVELSIVSYGSCVVLVNVHINELDSIGVVSDS